MCCNSNSSSNSSCCCKSRGSGSGNSGEDNGDIITATTGNIGNTGTAKGNGSRVMREWDQERNGLNDDDEEQQWNR